MRLWLIHPTVGSASNCRGDKPKGASTSYGLVQMKADTSLRDMPVIVISSVDEMDRFITG